MSATGYRWLVACGMLLPLVGAVSAQGTMTWHSATLDFDVAYAQLGEVTQRTLLRQAANRDDNVSGAAVTPASGAVNIADRVGVSGLAALMHARAASESEARAVLSVDRARLVGSEVARLSSKVAGLTPDEAREDLWRLWDERGAVRESAEERRVQAEELKKPGGGVDAILRRMAEWAADGAVKQAAVTVLVGAADDPVMARVVHEDRSKVVFVRREGEWQEVDMRLVAARRQAFGRADVTRIARELRAEGATVHECAPALRPGEDAAHGDDDVDQHAYFCLSVSAGTEGFGRYLDAAMPAWIDANRRSADVPFPGDDGRRALRRYVRTVHAAWRNWTEVLAITAKSEEGGQRRCGTAIEFKIVRSPSPPDVGATMRGDE